MLIRNATLPDGRTGIDILVQQGRIAALGDHLFHGQPAPAGSEDIDAAGWLLIDHRSEAAGAGRAYGRGDVFTADGTLVASFVQEAMLRKFPEGQDPRGRSSTIF